MATATTLSGPISADAADAIIGSVEPEPDAYVRICDVYGAGWWYLPGTETCIRLNGDLRVQYETLKYHDSIQGEDKSSAHDADYRARLNIRLNNETELGTLASRFRFTSAASAGTGTRPGEGHYDLVSSRLNNLDAPTRVDWAVISIAGLRTGYSDNYWNTAGNGGFYQARYDGPYGDIEGLYVDYTFSANGWNATIGAESGEVSGEPGNPDLYGGITYSNNGLYLAGIVYRDSSADAYAWKARFDYDISSIADGLAVGGWYMSDDGRTDYVKGHAWGVTAKIELTEKILLFGGIGGFEDNYFDKAGVCGTNGNTACGLNTGYDTWTLGVAFKITNNIFIQPEYQVVTYDDENLTQRNFGQFNLRIETTF
ncbi:MAG: porin [Rhizobiaceae bacterium]